MGTFGTKGVKGFVFYSPVHLINDCDLQRIEPSNKPKLINLRERRFKGYMDQSGNNINRGENNSKLSGKTLESETHAVTFTKVLVDLISKVDNIRLVPQFFTINRSSTTRTPHRPQRPKKIMKSIWVKKESTVGSQTVLPKIVSVKGSAMINQTWRPKGAYLDSCDRDIGDKDKLSDFKEFKGGYVAFGNDSKRGRISGKGTIKTILLRLKKVYLSSSPKFKFVDEDLVILRAPRKNDVYSLDLKNIIPFWRSNLLSDEGYLLVSLLAASFRVYNRVTRKVQDCLHVDFLENQENQKGKGPDWMFDLELLTPSMNYIPVRKENYADSGENVSTYDDVEDLDDQQFIVHGPSINAVQNKHSEERTADKEVPLSSEEQALHDELVSLMHQESIAKVHNDAQRNAFEKEKRRIALEKGKECVNSTFTLSTANTPSHSTGNTPTDSDDDVPKDGVFSTNSFDDENEEDGEPDYNNMDHTIDVTSTPTLRIHKNHPQSQIIGKSTAGILTRRKLKESASDTSKIWRRGAIDKTLFIKKDRRDIMLVQVYVDDIIFGSTKSSMVKDFEELMQKEFKMSSMGELTFFLGLQVKQTTAGIFLSQDKYVKDILNKFDFRTIKPASTPIEAHKSLGKDVDVHLYRSMIGCLMYLTASRPDIMFAVCLCARFQVTPKVSHMHAVKRIFRYLKHQPKLGLWYPKDSPFHLEAFSDSDYAGDNHDRRSTSGGCQYLGGRLTFKDIQA
ncbi:uncharacterized mitochondrial protein-like protein [Tanacetum coccineum]